MIKICIFDKLQTNAVQTPGNSILPIFTDNPCPGAFVPAAPLSERVLYKRSFP